MDEDREPGSLPSALTGCVTWGKALCFSEPACRADNARLDATPKNCLAST